MTMQINPALVRAMANDYDAATAPMADHDFPTTNVSGETFGDVELAAWFSAVGQQFDNAGVALHDGATAIAHGLRVTATEAATSDERAEERVAPSLEALLLGQPTTGQGTGPYGGPL